MALDCQWLRTALWLRAVGKPGNRPDLQALWRLQRIIELKVDCSNAFEGYHDKLLLSTDEEYVDVECGSVTRSANPAWHAAELERNGKGAFPN
jgi:hypothetical protein